ncbi:MAG TPA: hypothetical protein VEN47_07445 [Myxococcota bacterium]|nr:hypothetical protein [Myxococcota bacterium]
MSEDERWIETMRREFRPAPLAPERASRMRRELAERLASEPPRRGFAVPALSGAALAAAATLWLFAPARVATHEETAVTSAEIDAFVDPDGFARELAERPDYLPADYEGLALLLDDDAADR